jgi:hypothetical protein
MMMKLRVKNVPIHLHGLRLRGKEKTMKFPVKKDLIPLHDHHFPGKEMMMRQRVKNGPIPRRGLLIRKKEMKKNSHVKNEISLLLQNEDPQIPGHQVRNGAPALTNRWKATSSV